MSQLLLDESPLIVLPSLARAVGLNEAIFLQQLHYWVARSSVEYEGRQWVYNSRAEWIKQFPFWSVATFRRTVETLVKLNLIFVEQLSEDKRDKTNYYAINYDALEASGRLKMSQSIGSKCANASAQNEPMTIYTETTTETTHDIGRKRGAQIPKDFAPNERHFELAIKQGVNVKQELEAFVDYHQSRGSVFKDWNAAFRTWLRNAARFGRTGTDKHKERKDWLDAVTGNHRSRTIDL